LRRNLSDDDSDIKCPHCGAEGPRRSISTFISGAFSDDSCAPSGGG
jgi:hypothetical protein